MPSEELRLLASDTSRAVMRLSRRLRGMRNESVDLSMSQLSALSALQANGQASMGELAALEKVQPPSMTRVIDQLANRGLVARVPHPFDRRATRVGITTRGHEVLAADRARRHAWLATQLAELSPGERATLAEALAILERVNSA
ncbi:MAG: MarR family winged helix-turn-helix transcriptional regulator [Candidatus Nanopelagicales bacterium]